VTDLDDDALSDVRLHELGFIFQSFNLIPQLTVRENIELPLYYLGLDATESASRAEATAELVGLSDRLEHRPMELSGGQQQRVAIARALVNEARVLLADEPTGNLDSVTGRQIMDMLHELNGKGKTIIMVTHDMEIAAETPLIMHIRDGIIDRIEERGR
jgi:putative ABC transport system ATP-binding protein